MPIHVQLATIVQEIEPALAYITPAFVVLTLWRLSAIEKKIDKLDKLIVEHLKESASGNI